jgi:hypothetical protein
MSIVFTRDLSDPSAGRSIHISHPRVHHALLSHTCHAVMAIWRQRRAICCVLEVVSISVLPSLTKDGKTDLIDFIKFYHN